jgi:ADP-ribose pyrophosphatase YjhB (NUDIX family)/NTP pyrophosphatase (non-canonical NTP hydrolase)
MDMSTWAIVEQQRAWLDAHAGVGSVDGNVGDDCDADAAPERLAALAQLRILKLSEEVGEVASALIGASGANPRKGRTHEMSDVADELADVAITALVALSTITGDAREALAARLGQVYTRSLEHGAPPLPRASYDPDRAAWLASLPRVLAATVVLFTDDQGRVLLVEQGYRAAPTNWALPGGGLEDDEPPRVGARREVLEEIALNVEPGRLLAVNWHPATDRPPLIVYVFDGGVLSDERIKKIQLLDGELTRFGFFTLEEARPLLRESAHREIKTALAVRDGREECTDLLSGHGAGPRGAAAAPSPT